MSRLALVLALGAAALAGWTLSEVTGLRSEVAAQRSEIADLTGRLGQAVEALGRAPDSVPPLRAEGAPAAARRPAPAVDEPLLEGREVPPEVLVAAVRDLRSRLAEQEEETRSLRTRLEEGGGAGPQVITSPTFIPDVDTAVKVLDLTSRQHADLDAIVTETRRRLADLREIPNDEGKTWADVSKARTAMAGDEGGFQISVPDFGAIQRWRQSKVPGTNETYGQAEQRIREEGKREARSLLDPEQQERWDGAETDPLFGPGGNGAFISFVSGTVVSSDD